MNFFIFYVYCTSCEHKEYVVWKWDWRRNQSPPDKSTIADRPQIYQIQIYHLWSAANTHQFNKYQSGTIHFKSRMSWIEKCAINFEFSAKKMAKNAMKFQTFQIIFWCSAHFCVFLPLTTWHWAMWLQIFSIGIPTLLGIPLTSSYIYLERTFRL